MWLDRNGHEIGTVAQLDNYGSFSISPDGRKVAVGIGDPQVPNEQDLWIYDLERGTRMRFTHAPGLEYKPIWSFQGYQIVFTSEKDSSTVLLKELNSNEEGRQVLPAAKDQRANDWSSDGRHVIFTRVGVNDKMDLWVLPLTEGGKPFNFTQSPFFDYWGKFSPDGKWVAFVSDESGGGEVYVAPFPNTGQKIRVSTAGGDEPLWSKDGKEMFYIEGQYMVSVPVK